ncbi:MAG: hypothetical protein IPM52_04905 [Bacteroidetes bacterium]|nr:hypothetical protein [Bacteroidota bacterium]
MLIAAALVLASCSSTGYVADDAYFSRKQQTSVMATAVQGTGIAESAKVQSQNTDYEYQTHYQQNAGEPATEGMGVPTYTKTETVTDPDGTTYSTTETYYDSEYARRFRRFGDNYGSSFGYFDGFYDGCFSCSRSSFGFGFGYPFGWSFSYRYGYPFGYSSFWGYDPFFYDPWFYSYRSWGWPYYSYGWGGYWSGYNHGYWNGFWDGYYYGGGSDWGWGFNRPRTYYGHRGSSIGGGTLVPGGSARGSNQSTAAASPRGTNTRDYVSGDIPQTSLSERGTRTYDRGTTTASPAVSERAARQDAGISREASDRTGLPREVRGSDNTYARPGATERINQYRQERYDRPQLQSRPAYERPKQYTSPSMRQPKSSSEYVRPQAEPGRISGNMRETPQTTAPSGSGVYRQVNPTRQEPQRTTSPSQGTMRSQPAQSRPSGTSGGNFERRSYSTPSARPAPSSSPSYSSPSRSSGSSGSYNAPARSSESSSGSSRGSSSGNSSGSRR